MMALGAGSASARIFTATQAVCSFVVALPVGLLLAWPTYALLHTLLRVGGFHGAPVASPDWALSAGVGVAVSFVLAALGGWRARPLRVHRPAESARGRVGRWARVVVGVALGGVSVGLLRGADSAGLGALFGAALLAVVSAVLVAPAVFLALCRVVRPFDRLTWLWPARLALTRDRVFRLSSSVTVAAFTLVLFSALVSVVSGSEQLQRAGLARQLSPSASVVTRADGSPADRADAEAACRRAQGCVGLVYLAPSTSDASGAAFATQDVRRALFVRPPEGASADSPRWSAPADGLTGSPWSRLEVGAPPALPGAWQALPVFTEPTSPVGASSAALRRQPAREWAMTGPSEAIIRGAGAADIAPMLAPLITVTFLFSAAAAYLLSAGFHHTARVTSALGAGRAHDLAAVAADAAVRSVSVYLVAWVAWTLMARGVAGVADARGLAVPAAGMPVPLHLSFVVLFVVTALGGALGARAGRRLA